MIAGKGRRPVFEHCLQRAAVEMLADQVLHQIGEPEPVQCRLADMEDAVEGQLPVHPHPLRPPGPLELPGIEAAQGGQAQVDAAMAGQFLRGARAAGLGEIAGCCHHQHPHFRADRHRDHVLVDDVAQPHAGVEFLGDDVDQPIVGLDLQPDVRIAGERAAQPGPEHGLEREFVGGDADIAGGPLAQVVERRDMRLDLVEMEGDGAQHPLAGLGGGDAARGAVEQPHAQPLLKPAHAVAERRRRHAQLRCRAGEAALARHGDEGSEIGEILTVHC